MIPLPRSASTPAAPRIKIVGLGSAGCNMLDRMVLDGLEHVELLAVNTDTQALNASVAPEKIQIGETVTRGLGCGGDPELGREAVEEGAGELSDALAGCSVVFLLTGLGGGTGSGTLPVVAEMARQTKAVVIVLATLPFGFEGKRRAAQAADALKAVEGSADFVVCFENDRMGDLVSARAGIQEAFARVDELVSQCVKTLATMARQRGLLHAGLDEVAQAFADLPMRALFGYGEASGDNRVYEAMEAALRSPLLERGKYLKNAQSIVVHLNGGTDLTLSEVQTLMDEVQRHLPAAAELHFGLATDTHMHGRLGVTMIAAVSVDDLVNSRKAAAAAVAAAAAAAEAEALALAKEREEEEAALRAAAEQEQYLQAPEDELEEAEAAHEEEVDEDEEEEQLELTSAAPTPTVRPIIPLKPRPVAAARPLFAQVRPTAAPATRPAPVIEPEPEPEPVEDEYEEELEAEEEEQPVVAAAPAPAPAPVASVPKPVDEVNRGRFEKSEPTIIDGEDLDVPTFLRRRVR